MASSRSPANTPKRIAAAREREVKALEMAKTGATMTAIAIALGYGSASGAWQAIQRALARIPQAEAAELREIHAQRLGDMYRHTLSVLARKHPVLYKGKPVIIDGMPVDDDGVKLRAIETLVKVDESYRKLLGLDLAKKIELTGADGGPVQVEHSLDAMVEQVIGALERSRQTAIEAESSEAPEPGDTA